MQPDGNPQKEAGRPELLIDVDHGTIERLSGSAKIRLRAVCTLKNFSLYTMLKKAGGIRGSEEEIFEIQAAREDFEKLERPGTVVNFRNGSEGASFEVCCMHSLLPIFETEDPLTESLIKKIQVQDADARWL